MNEPVYRVALPFKIGQWVKDTCTGQRAVVTGYLVHSDLSVSATLSWFADGTHKSIDLLSSRLEPTEKVIE